MGGSGLKFFETDTKSLRYSKAEMPSLKRYQSSIEIPVLKVPLIKPDWPFTDRITDAPVQAKRLRHLSGVVLQKIQVFGCG